MPAVNKLTSGADTPKAGDSGRKGATPCHRSRTAASGPVRVHERRETRQGQVGVYACSGGGVDLVFSTLAAVAYLAVNEAHRCRSSRVLQRKGFHSKRACCHTHVEGRLPAQSVRAHRSCRRGVLRGVSALIRRLDTERQRAVLGCLHLGRRQSLNRISGALLYCFSLCLLHGRHRAKPSEQECRSG